MTSTRSLSKRSAVPNAVEASCPSSPKKTAVRKKQKVSTNTQNLNRERLKKALSTSCEEGDRPVQRLENSEGQALEAPQSEAKETAPDGTSTSPPSKKHDSASKDHSYFLVKSEPETRMQDGHDMKFSIDDLADEPNSTACWDGVRNYEARNIMREMRNGDRAFFYHSNSRHSRPSIVGEVEIVREAYPDHTAFDKSDPHYDSKSNQENPRWFMVDVRLLRKFSNPVSLDDIKAHEQLSNMQLVKRGRISVQRVTFDEWAIIMDMAGEKL